MLFILNSETQQNENFPIAELLPEVQEIQTFSCSERFHQSAAQTRKEYFFSHRLSSQREKVYSSWNPSRNQVLEQWLWVVVCLSLKLELKLKSSQKEARKSMEGDKAKSSSGFKFSRVKWCNFRSHFSKPIHW